MANTDFSLDGELLAVVDIGSNGVRMNVYSIGADGSYSVIDSSRSMLKLVSYINDGVLSRDGEGKLLTVMREYLARANAYPCDRFTAFATASLRSISNSESVLGRIKRTLGVDVEIISGESEAMYDYVSVKKRFGLTESDSFVICDMGGGSTEFITYDGKDVSLCSLPIGALKLWKLFVDKACGTPYPSERECEMVAEYVRSELKSAPRLAGYGGTVYLIGGTARVMCRVDAEAKGMKEASDGYALSAVDFLAAVDALIADSRDSGALISRICPERKTSVVTGAVAFGEIIRHIGAEDIVLSLAGVREGYVSEHVLKKKHS